MPKSLLYSAPLARNEGLLFPAEDHCPGDGLGGKKNVSGGSVLAAFPRWLTSGTEPQEVEGALAILLPSPLRMPGLTWSCTWAGRQLHGAPSPRPRERTADANTRQVMAGEVLDGRNVLEACMGHTLNICQPCATALPRERNAVLGFHKQAHRARGRQ